MSIPVYLLKSEYHFLYINFNSISIFVFLKKTEGKTQQHSAAEGSVAVSVGKRARA